MNILVQNVIYCYGSLSFWVEGEWELGFKTAYGVSFDEVEEFVEGNEVVKVWCKKFRAAPRKAWLSGSRLDKARILCRFFKWLRIEKSIDLSPSELLERHRKLRLSGDSTIEDRQWLLNLVFDYSRDNRDFAGYADRSKYGMFSCVKSFVDRYEVPLTTAKNVYGTKRKKKNHRKQISLTDAKKLLGKMSQRDRTINFLQIQSGMEIGAVLDKFNYIFFSQVKPQLDTGCKRLKIEFDERKGNGTWYYTYISRDGIHELRKWLEERKKIINSLVMKGRKLPQSVINGEPIFITRSGEPLTSNNFVRHFNKMMNGKVVTHMFRILFESEAKVPDRGIDRGIIKFFMGHITDIDDVGGIYDKNPEIRQEIFEQEYAKLEPFINIYTSSVATMRADPLLQDIEQLTQLPHGREFFNSIVEDAKAKLAEMLKQQRLE